MSGTDARRGFNFQDACTVAYILDAVDHADWWEIQVEGSKDIEDVNVFDLARKPLLRSQVKQKNNNDLWKPAELRKVLREFVQYDDPDSTAYHFVYGGREGPEFTMLRQVLEKVRNEGISALTAGQTAELETRFGSDIMSFLGRAWSRLELIRLGDRHSVRNANVLRLVDMLAAQGRQGVNAQMAHRVHDDVLLAVIERSDKDSPYQRTLTREHIFKLLGANESSIVQATSALAQQNHSSSSLALTVLAEQVNQLGERVAGEVALQYEQTRTALREGRAEEAWAWLGKVQGDNLTWQALEPEQKARILGLRANLEMSRPGGLERAGALADEAQAIAPKLNQARLHALIAYHKGGPAAALPVLEGQEDIDSANMRAALLLESGRVEDSLQVLKALLTAPDGSHVGLRIEHAESLRLQALGFLANNDIEQCRLAIQKALELAPRWVGIRYSAAIIDYYSALSAPALPGYLAPWPMPVSLEAVKRDDTSLQRLRSAEDTFRQLIETRALEGEGEIDRFLPVWRLACLLNDPERQEAATDYCRSLLQADRTNYVAILWATTRHLDIDLTPSIEALTGLVNSGHAELPHISTLFHYLLSGHNTEAARKLLEDQRDRFAGEEEKAEWTAMYSLVLSVEGKIEEALAITEAEQADTDSGLRRHRASILGAQGNQTGEWEPLLSYLEASYQATGDLSFLFDSCRLRADLDDWQSAAEHAESLVDGLQTEAALRLAAQATYSTREYDRCLQILNKYRSICAQGRLPADLQRIRALCKRGLGVLPQAIADAEALVHDDPSTRNLLMLADMYFAKGDLWALPRVARLLGNRPDVSPADLLVQAWRLQWEDRNLATELWRKAVARGVPDDAVGYALNLGFKLGLDHELSSLMARKTELAREGKGGFQLLDMRGLFALAEPRQKQAADLQAHYWNNELPVHLVAERLNQSLAVLYHSALQVNAKQPDPTRQFALLARYGGHPLAPGFPKNELPARLLADATSILLAAHLDVLDAIENTFAPIFVPDSFVATLVQFRDDATQIQPSRLDAYRRILDLHNRGLLHVAPPRPESGNPDELPWEEDDYARLKGELGEAWVDLLVQACRAGGFVVDFLPLRARTLDLPPVTLPEGLRGRVINCRTVLEALRQHGPLAQQDYDRGLAALGSEGREFPDGVVPSAGSALFCDGGVPEVLADTQLLGPLCSRFKVYVEQAVLDEARASVEGYDRARAVMDWLTGLIRRINGGLEPSIGRYALLPTPAKLDEDRDDPDKPAVHGLLTLMATPTQPGDVIWVDDRFATSYSLQGVAPIIGINEVLKLLVGAAALSEGEYYEKLHQLRASNVRFIHVQADEILHQLRQANVNENGVVETEQLKVLRRYVAACLLPGPGPTLQRPAPDMAGRERNPIGELPFLFALRQAITEAMGAVWDVNSAGHFDEAVARARAGWILDNLYVEPFDPHPAPETITDAESEAYLAAMHLAALLLQLLSLKGEPRDARGESGGHPYANWLWERMVGPRRDSEPRLTGLVADVLKNGVTQVLDIDLADLPPEVADRAYLIPRLLYLRFPLAIRDEWDQDPEFMAKLGLTSRSVTTVEDIDFESRTFARVVGKVLEGRAARITPLQPKKSIQFHPLKPPGTEVVDGMWFEHPTTKRKIPLDAADTTLGVLRRSVGDRETWLRQHKAWFDTSEAEYEQVVAEIAADTDPVRRVNTLDRWRDSNASLFYAEMEFKLRKREPLRLAQLMPPSATGLLRHLRLPASAPTGDGFAAALNRAAHKLVRECGAQQAIQRLCGLPVPLPQGVFDALAAISVDERRELIHFMLRTAPSPLTSIHLIRILLLFKHDSPAYERLARQIVRQLSSTQGASEFEAFLKLLRWIETTVETWAEASSLPEHLKLALVWAHAHRLFTIMGVCGLRLDWVPTGLNPSRYRNLANLFAVDDEYSRDVASPFRVAHAPFLLSALAYGIGDATTFIDDALQEIVVGATYRPVGDLTYPSVDLLHDMSNAANSLCSFLGGNMAGRFAGVVGDDATAILQPDKLQASLVAAIDELKASPADARAWTALHAVLGNLPPAPAVADALNDLILQVNFQELFAGDITTGVLAMHTVARQAPYLDSEAVWAHLESELLAITSFLAGTAKARPDQAVAPDQGMDSEPPETTLDWTNDTLGSYLMDWGYFLSKAAGSGQVMARKFANLLWEIVTRWPLLTDSLTKSTSNLAWTLPFDLARPFWSLLVRLRAEKQD